MVHYFQVLPNKTHTCEHRRKKPFSCKVCGSAFSVSSILKNHMQIHTGEKPFPCEVCGSSFSQNSHLKTHMKIHFL